MPPKFDPSEVKISKYKLFYSILYRLVTFKMLYVNLD